MSEKYEVIAEIGHGAFGKVYKVRNKSNGEILVKKMTPMDPKMKKYIEGEMKVNEIFRAFSPKYINYSREEYYETKKETHPAVGTVEKKYAVLILQYCDSGDLDKYIESKIILSEEETKRLAFQILSALQFCHDHDVMHRDLKVQNVLLNKEGDVINSYLCDFGLAKQTEFDTHTVLGTYAYMAPEIFQTVVNKMQKATYDKRVDIWSFGIMVYKMLTGVLPLNSMEDLSEFIAKKSLLIPKERSLSVCAMSFLESCLQVDPNKRKMIRDLLDHEFLQSTPIPWYYFKWVCEPQVQQEIDADSSKNTDKMNVINKEYSSELNSNVMMFSLSMYYQEL